MNNSQLLIYQTPEGAIKIDVRLEDETVWLTQAHMAEFFSKVNRQQVVAVLQQERVVYG